MADAIFEEPRLAQIYDLFEPERLDLVAYLALVGEFGAGRVLDIGCGTGTFACLIANRGVEVFAVDPAEASLEVARSKPGSESVHWLHGDATMLPPLRVDMATMTGNVAQVFITDKEWENALRGIRRALRPQGRLVFESRVPEKQAWKEWNREQSFRRIDVPGEGSVDNWSELTDVADSLVSFRTIFRFDLDGAIVISESTLRFRSLDEIGASLTAAGLVVEEVRDAPDRPGHEYVFIANLPLS